MNKEYIPLFLDFNETTQDLTDDECGRLVRAIVDYANGGNYEERLTGAEKIAFRFLKGHVDRNQAISEARAKAGANRSKNEQNETNGNKPEQNGTNENKPERNEANSLTKTKTKTETNTKTEIERENKPEQKRFVPPSAEDVAAYCRERKNNVDAERFVDFYASKGWRVGAQPMRDWKACVRTWEKRDKAPSASGPGKIVSAQMYEQRDYSQEDEDADAALDRLRNGG